MRAQSQQATNYFKSVINPWTNFSPRPDLDSTAYVPKKVLLNANVEAPSAGGGHIVFYPHSKRNKIEHWLLNPNGKYYFHEFIEFDESLGDHYSSARIVSSALKFYSSTVSGGQFNLSGTVTAVGFQDVLDLHNLPYREISAIRRNDVDFAMSVPVEDGVVCLMHPDGHDEFLPTDIDKYIDTSETYRFTSNWDTLDVPPWYIPDAVFGDSFVELELDNGGIPKNASGRMSLRFMATHTMPNGGSGGNLVVSIVWRIAPITLATQNFTVAKSHDDNIAGQETYVCTIDFDIPGELFAIRVSGSNQGTGGKYNFTEIETTYELHDYTARGYRSPGYLISYDGVTADQQLTLTGVANYEAVPNLELAKDVKTKARVVVDPIQLAFAQHALSRAVANPIPLVWTCEAYRMFLMSQKFTDYDVMVNTGMAAGFGDFLKSMLKRLGLIGAQAITPLAVEAFGPLAGPPAMALSQGLSDMIGDASGDPANMYRPRRLRY